MRDNAGQEYRFPPEPQQPDTLKPNTLISDTLLQLMITPPSKFTLLQNYPNPFNGGTILTFDITDEENVEITVFNILGQKIKMLYSGRPQIGRNTVRWYGTNERGCRVGTGVYIARLKTSKVTFTKKMLYVK